MPRRSLGISAKDQATTTSGSESLVGFCHAMHVFFLLHGGAAVVGRFHQLVCETMRHGFFAALARGVDHPAHGQCLATLRTHFDRHLVGRATDAAGFHLDRRLDVFERVLKHLERLLIGLVRALAHAAQRAVHDALRNRFLAVAHDHVHELREQLALVFRVRQDAALRCLVSSRHSCISFWPPSATDCNGRQLRPCLLTSPSDASRRTWSGPGDGH